MITLCEREKNNMEKKSEKRNSRKKNRKLCFGMLVSIWSTLLLACCGMNTNVWQEDTVVGDGIVMEESVNDDKSPAQEEGEHAKESPVPEEGEYAKESPVPGDDEHAKISAMPEIGTVENKETEIKENDAAAENLVAEGNDSVAEEQKNFADLEVHFIDVGQGDATLVKADGHYMLIDAGGNDKGTAIQLYLQKQEVEKLDYLILTHTDADHIGGADVIVTKFEIDTIFMSDYEKENRTYEDLLNAMEYKNMKFITPEVGAEYQLGKVLFTVLAPNATYADSNNSSIALLLENGETSFLFTGDCEEAAEKDILENGLDIDCDVYKVGHHGSADSSNQSFLEAVTPEYGIISCAEGNAYGHPHAATLNKLRSMGVEIFRTDEQGSIIAYSDGTGIRWNCAPSDTWKAGEMIGSSEKQENKKAHSDSGVLIGTESADHTEDVMGTEEATKENDSVEQAKQQEEYVIGNKNSKVFHRPTCKRLPKEKNRVIFDNREEALAAGYDNPCDYCKP